MTITKGTRKLSNVEFIQRMEKIRAKYSVTGTEFMKELVAGNVPLQGLKRFAVQSYYLTLRTGAPTIGKPYGFRNDGEEILAVAVKNAVGEIGYTGDPPHAYLAKAMCCGLGMTEDEIEATEITPEMIWYVERLNENNRTNVPRLRGSIEVTEADSAHSSQAVATALKEKYDLDDQTIAYWTIHGYADMEHGEENAAIAAELCQSREDQDRILDDARESMKMRRMVWDSFLRLW